MMHILRVLVVLLGLTLTTHSYAEGGTDEAAKLICSSAEPTALFTDFCYDSMFPIRLMGTIDVPTVTDVPPPPHAATYNFPPTGCYCTVCVLGVCFPVPGFLRGAWIPVQVIEATRAPGCVVMLEGMDFGGVVASNSRSGGEARRTASGDISGGFRHFTMYDFPLATVFAGMLGMANCAAVGPSYESIMTSVLLPFWERADLANLLFPEALGFATPFAAMSGPLSCAAASLGAGAYVDDLMFWSMGCWGRTYPLMGSYSSQGEVTGGSLIVGRAMYTMGAIARFSGGLFSKYGVTTVGNGVANAGCRPLPAPFLRKSEFKVGQIFPVPESGLGAGSVKTPTGSVVEASPIGMLLSRCAHRLGETEYKWGPHRKAMVTGEDAAYLVWRWVDCCSM